MSLQFMKWPCNAQISFAQTYMQPNACTNKIFSNLSTIHNNYLGWYNNTYICSTYQISILSHLHWIDNNLLSDWQHSFLPHCSCNSLLLLALNNWRQSIDLEFPTDVIYFDFCKAFNSVPHATLPLKLKAYDITLMVTYFLGFTASYNIESNML